MSDEMKTLHQLLEERATKLLPILESARKQCMVGHRIPSEVEEDLRRFRRRWARLKKQAADMENCSVEQILAVIERLEEEVNIAG